MPYPFKAGEKTKFKTFADYSQRGLSPWSSLTIHSIKDDKATVSLFRDEPPIGRVFEVPINILEVPMGWEEVYTASNSEENLIKMVGWLANRGGINVWASVDLSSAGRQMFTPADNGSDGKPHWSMQFVEKVVDPSRFKFMKYETQHGKPNNAKKAGWRYERKGGGYWWRETEWLVQK